MSKDNKEPGLEVKPKKVRTGEHTTTIFVFWQDQDGNRGISDFKTKPDLDTWMAGTNVDVIRVIRGRERKIIKKVIFQ